MIILDNCEHLIDEAALIAERLVSVNQNVLVLATSREPLRVTGEFVFALDPLETPIGNAELTAQEALSYPAIQLFCQRAVASRHDFELTDALAATISNICRRLDGIALAIELVATRVNAFSPSEIESMLDDQPQLFRMGRRTAASHHKTLMSMFDWSYALLSAEEQTVLRRLAIFAGAFTLDAAIIVGSGEDVERHALINALSSLTAKSLITVDHNGPARYSLLGMTRAYARQKLEQAGEFAETARKHAVHFRDRYENAESMWVAVPEDVLQEEDLLAVDDIRAALEWAFSEQGDTLLGISLTVSAIAVWLQIPSLMECRRSVKIALSKDRVHAPDCEVLRMKLYEALAASSMYTVGMTPEVLSSWKAALAIAESLGSKEYQLRILFTSCCGLVYGAKYRESDELLSKFHAVALHGGNNVALSDGERLTAYAHHRVGRQATARALLERVLSRNATPLRWRRLSHFHVDWYVAALTILTNVLWLQGFPDQARQVADDAWAEAEASERPLTMVYALVLAIVPLALCLKDKSAAESKLRVLHELLEEHGLALFDATTRCLQGALHIQQNKPDGISLMTAAIASLRKERFGMRFPFYAGMLAEARFRSGDREAAQPAIDDALQWADSNEELWCKPELLRIKGEILAAHGSQEGVEQAVSHYEEALELARDQGALAWQLRAGTSLARLLRKQGQIDRASAVISPLIEHFTEGHDTPDFMLATQVLRELETR